MNNHNETLAAMLRADRKDAEIARFVIYSVYSSLCSPGSIVSRTKSQINIAEALGILNAGHAVY